MKTISEIAVSLGISEFWLGAIAGAVLCRIFFPRRSKAQGIVNVDSLNIQAQQSFTDFGVEQPSVSVSTKTTNLDNATAEKIKDALKDGNKIEAIKILREAVGCDLVTAKSTIEGLEKVFNLAKF